MPTTEIATLPLVPGSEIGDPNNPAAIVVKDSGDTLIKTDGLQTLQFGMEVENPDHFQMIINWDSKKNHDDFEASDVYPPFLKRILSVASGRPSIIHVDFKPEGGLISSLSAPVTEVATFYFDGEPPADCVENATKFGELCEKEGTLLGWSFGLTYEEIEKEGVKGKGAVLVVGWKCVEDHMKFRETSTFKENVSLLGGEVKKREVHHTTFMNFVSS